MSGRFAYYGRSRPSSSARLRPRSTRLMVLANDDLWLQPWHRAPGLPAMAQAQPHSPVLPRYEVLYVHKFTTKRARFRIDEEIAAPIALPNPSKRWCRGPRAVSTCHRLIPAQPAQPGQVNQLVPTKMVTRYAGPTRKERAGGNGVLSEPRIQKQQFLGPVVRFGQPMGGRGW